MLDVDKLGESVRKVMSRKKELWCPGSNARGR